jgi:hypothetical protein
LIKYIVIYTQIVFIIHLGLLSIASVTKSAIYVLPFIYALDFNFHKSILYLPALLVFDMLAVGTVLYMLKWKKVKLKLPGEIISSKRASSEEENKGSHVTANLIRAVTFVFTALVFGFDMLKMTAYPDFAVIQLSEHIRIIITLILLIEGSAAVISMFNSVKIVDVIRGYIVLMLSWIITTYPRQHFFTGDINGENAAGIKILFALLAVTIIGRMLKDIIEYEKYGMK